MYLLAPSFRKILKKFLEAFQSYEDMAFSGPFVLSKKILVQTIIITFIYLLTLFIVQNLKTFLLCIKNYEDAPFWHPKWSICPKQKVF